MTSARKKIATSVGIERGAGTATSNQLCLSFGPTNNAILAHWTRQGRVHGKASLSLVAEACLPVHPPLATAAIRRRAPRLADPMFCVLASLLAETVRVRDCLQPPLLRFSVVHPLPP